MRQFRLPDGLSSVDAANCYDNVAHALAALNFRAFGAPNEAVHVMLKTIQEMKHVLRTAYGDSKRFRGSKVRLNSKDCVKEMVPPQLAGRSFLL